MLRARLALGAVAVVVAGVIAGVMISRPSSAGPAHLASAPSAAHQTAPSAGGPPPPPMPNGVTHPPALVNLSIGGRTAPCTMAMGTWDWEPAQGWPTSVSQLYQFSDAVVLATLTDSRGYWQRDDGNLPAPNLEHSDWAALTASTFHIDQVFKASPLLPSGPWLQTIDAGADPSNIAVCSHRAVQRVSWPQPATASHQYVLFLQSYRGHLFEGLGPVDRWPIINGAVHSDSDLQPSAWTFRALGGSVPAPASLTQFVGAMQVHS